MLRRCFDYVAGFGIGLLVVCVMATNFPDVTAVIVFVSLLWAVAVTVTSKEE